MDEETLETTYKRYKPIFSRAGKSPEEIKSLNFSNKISDKIHLKALLVHFKKLPNLTELNFSSCHLMEDMIDFMVPIAMLPNLQSFDIFNNYFGDSSNFALLDALLTHPTLTFVNLGSIGLNNQFGSQIAKHLKTNCALKRLNLQDSHLSAKIWNQIFESLQDNHVFASLDIRYCHFDVECIKTLSTVLMKRKSPLKIGLKNVNILINNEKLPDMEFNARKSKVEVEFFDSIINNLIYLPVPLIGLDISDFPISCTLNQTIMSNFSHALRFNVYLEKLDMSHATFSDQILCMLFDGLRSNITLKILDLNHCKIIYEKIHNPYELVKRICEFLKENQGLEKLIMRNGYFQEVGSVFWKVMKDHIDDIHNLEVLEMSDQSFDEYEYCKEKFMENSDRKHQKYLETKAKVYFKILLDQKMYDVFLKFE